MELANMIMVLIILGIIYVDDIMDWIFHHWDRRRAEMTETYKIHKNFDTTNAWIAQGEMMNHIKTLAQTKDQAIIIDDMFTKVYRDWTTVAVNYHLVPSGKVTP